ncbi:MAG: MFS transporter [Thermoleophilaceae bacterium]
MRRLVLLVAAIVLVDTMFYAAITPLLPYYSHHFDLSKSAAGLLAAAYPAGTLIASLPSGWLAARIGVRPTVLVGLGLMVVSSVAFGFAHSVAVLDGARFLQGVGGAASWAGGLAWLIARAEGSRRAELIGTALAAAIAGALLGPVLGSAASVTSPKIVFSLVGVLGVILACLTLTEHAPGPTGGHGFGAFRPALRDSRLLAGMWLTTLGALLFGTLAVLAPLRLDHLGASNVVIGAAFLLAAAGAATTSPMVGRWSDRAGWRTPVRIGLLASSVFAILLPLPRSAALLFVLVVVADPAFGASYPPAGAMISDGAERAGLDQGYAFGLFNLAWASGQVVGDAGSAGIAQATSDAVPYAFLSVACLLTFLALGRRSRIGAADSGLEELGREGGEQRAGQLMP